MLIVAAGLAVHGALPDSIATDIAGDALYAALIYAGIVVLAPRWPAVVVGAVTFGWCGAVELLQLTGLPERWAEAWAPLVLVFGTVFDARDLLIYSATALVVTLADRVGSRLGSAADV